MAAGSLMAAKGLTEAWRGAEAAKPRTGRSGVVLGPRAVDPRISGARCAAWAVGPNGERAQCKADSPHTARAHRRTASVERVAARLEPSTLRGGAGTDSAF